MGLDLSSRSTKDRTLNNCAIRRVNGTIVYSVTGWNVQTSTSFSLIPLAIISFITAALIVTTITQKEPLMVFDPTNPVSLITAASASGVALRPEAYGDPEDDEARTARIRYGIIPKVAQLGRRERQDIEEMAKGLAPEVTERLIAKVEDIVQSQTGRSDEIWGFQIQPSEARVPRVEEGDSLLKRDYRKLDPVDIETGKP